VLFPASTDEVSAAVKAASRYGVVVYPVSRGKNWGYGDACAPTEGAAILDLSRMNRIVEVDRTLAYAVVEPGVTQRQLFDHLAGHAPDLVMDCTGAGAGASIVGNTLERGFGHSRYGDHVTSTCGFEAVLADGAVLRTGFGHIPNARTARVYPHGAGPALDGLLAQANLAVVTRMGLWLMRRPSTFSAFFAAVEEDAGLERLVDTLRELRMQGVFHSAVHIANDLRVLSSRGRYPFDRANGVTPLPSGLRATMGAEAGIGRWSVAGAVSGTAEDVRASKAALRRGLRPLGRFRLVDDRTLALANRAAGLLSKIGSHGLSRQLDALKPVYNLLRGVPDDDALRGAHWRVRQGPPTLDIDPRDSGAGLVWVSPVVPATGEDARRVTSLVEPVFARHGFDALVTFTLINERALIGILNVAFDRSLRDETEAAARCYEELTATLLDAGYPPYRCSTNGFDALRAASGVDEVFWDVAHAIKRALDPGDIIARGRYLSPLE
jgi:4-cresol dehydrogenase (hydroxylating)